MVASADVTKKVWTEAELEGLPEDGFIHEVVNGELVMSPKNNFQHENICTRLLVAMEYFNLKHRLGAVRGYTAGFWMHNRNCRAPDIFFIPKTRLNALGFRPNHSKLFPCAPGLAAGLLFPIDRR